MRHQNRTTTWLATTLWLGLGLAASPASAQTAASPYAGEQTRAIKALSAKEVTGLLEGQGAGFAKAAELNGYPGPMHTLELKERLGLSAEQVVASASLLATHKARAREIGSALVQAERRLDALFASRRAEPAAVEQATRDVAVLQAHLRAEHLNTHLTQTALLSAEQIARYSVLRGYTDTPAADAAVPAAGHHGHHSQGEPQ